MKPYPKYKATNIPWLPEVPEGWEVKSVRVLFSENTNINTEMETSNALQFQFGEIIPKKRLETEDNLIRYTIVETDDIIVNGLNLNYDFLTQRVAIVKEKGVITPVYIALRPQKRINPMYACFLLKAMDSQKLINGMGTGIRLTLSFSEFKKTNLPVPPLDIQNLIVNFLDNKVSAINKLIEAKKLQIERELLKEWKRAAINEELKGCTYKKGVRFRTMFSLGKGLNITKADLKDKGIPCVNYGEIHSKYGFEVNPDIHKLRFVDESFLQTNRQSLLNNGDFVFADTSEDIVGSGNFTYLNSSTTTFAGYHTIIARPKTKINRRFVAYLFDFIFFREQIQKEINGVKVYSITRSILNDTFIFLPSETEQRRIVSELDAKCAKSERLITKLQEEIVLFGEYKTRLISDVITEKVDMRNIASQEVNAESHQTKIIAFTPKQRKEHNKNFEDAVILAALVNAFGTEEHPFTAFDCQKFPYLLHRHIEGVAENYNKFAAGPYNPALKYKTARPIALKKKYIREYIGKYKGFVADENVPEAMNYFMEWYSNEPLEWIKQFRFIKNRKNELELLATVDMAIVDLRNDGLSVTMQAVKDLIKASDVWKDKLKRPIFSDTNIERAINWSYKLFGNN